jgi:hypothetical protein
MFELNQRSIRIRVPILVMGTFMALARTPQIFAHEGPPFPILMDEPLAGHIVSVWADPDIGEARFFIVVEAPTGAVPAAVPTVSMWVEPVNGRLERATYVAKQQMLRNQLQFEAHPHFDQRDMWTIGFQLTDAREKSAQLTTQIESTPPGFGFWDFAIYLFPFLLLGGMWVLAMVRRRRMEYSEPDESEHVAAAFSAAEVSSHELQVAYPLVVSKAEHGE